MNIKSRTVNGIVILELDGRFDANEAENVRQMLKEAVRVIPAKVVVNLKMVNFIDSSGLAVLVQGMKRSRNNKGDVHLCNLQQKVRIIFELTRLDKAFKIFSDLNSAMADFA